MACSPFRLALGNELIDNTYRGRLRAAQWPPELLDPLAWLLRKKHQPSGHRAGMPGSAFNSRGQGI